MRNPVASAKALLKRVREGQSKAGQAVMQRPVVLVVDDEEAQRYTVRRVLSAAGFHVLEAASGAEALEKAKLNPGTIVLDVDLPDFSGFEVCRRLKQDSRTAHIPVVFLSATLANEYLHQKTIST